MVVYCNIRQQKKWSNVWLIKYHIWKSVIWQLNKQMFGVILLATIMCFNVSLENFP